MKTFSNDELKPFIEAYVKERPAFMGLIRPQEAFLFTRFKKLLVRPVVDFGCGDGFFTQTVFKKNKMDFGIEIYSNPRVHEARQRNMYSRILLYDGGTIPLKTSSVSSVFSNCVFEHIPEISHSVAELNRILKPGGILITSVMTSRWSKEMLGSRLFGESYVKWMNRRQEHYSLLSQQQWRNLFKKQGFSVKNEIGYVNPQTAKWLDAWHYLSLPSLISYRLFGTWNLWKNNPLRVFFIQSVSRILSHDIGSKQNSAVFFVLQKKKNAHK